MQYHLLKQEDKLNKYRAYLRFLDNLHDEFKFRVIFFINKKYNGKAPNDDATNEPYSRHIMENIRNMQDLRNEQ